MLNSSSRNMFSESFLLDLPAQRAPASFSHNMCSAGQLTPIYYSHCTSSTSTSYLLLSMTRSQKTPMTSPPSSTSSSSSSDFEFTIPHSPSSNHLPSNLCPADELFYKGQLLPLHLSPRRSMVRTLLASSSTSSSDATSTSRDSNGSSSSSSYSNDTLLVQVLEYCDRPIPSPAPKKSYLSSFTTRFSSVFLHRGNKKDPTFSDKKSTVPVSSAKERLKKYVRKVKPLYEKLSSLQQKPSNSPLPEQQNKKKKTFSFSIRREREPAAKRNEKLLQGKALYWRKRCPASCPSSMGSSPTHSCLMPIRGGGTAGGGLFAPALLASSSSMEDLQSAIQGAIAHCKNTMMVANVERASLE